VLLQCDQTSPLGLTCQDGINDPPAVAVAMRSAFCAEERVTGAQPAKAPAQTVLYFASAALTVVSMYQLCHGPVIVPSWKCLISAFKAVVASPNKPLCKENESPPSVRLM
jgi:hypothetical protein